MRVLVDTNVVLDLLLQRKPYFTNCDQSAPVGYFGSKTVQAILPDIGDKAVLVYLKLQKLQVV